MITSPDGLGMDVGTGEYYYEIEDVPEKYRKYLFVPDITSELDEVRFDFLVVEKNRAFQKISGAWLVRGITRLNVGVMIYEDEIRVVRDEYDQYVYKYSYGDNNHEHDVFEKENINGEKEYSIFFYDDNKKYFVSGQLEVEMMEKLAIEYMNYVIK